MYRDGKMLGTNAILFVCILFCINKVWSTDIEFLENDMKHDVTTIYRIQDHFIPRLSDFADYGFKGHNFLSAFYGNYSISIRSRTNAIGIPSNFPNKIDFKNNILALFDDSLLQNKIIELKVSYNNRYWETNHITSNGENCNRNNYNNAADPRTTYNLYDYPFRWWLQTTTPQLYQTNKEEDNMLCYGVYEFLDGTLFKDNGCYSYQREKNIFSFYLTPKNELTCLSLTYRLNSLHNYNYYEFILNQNDMRITSVELEKGDGIKTLRFNHINLMEGLKYEISLRIIKQCYSPEVKLKFGLLRISQCSNNDDANNQLVPLHNINGLEHTYSLKNILGVDKKLEKLREYDDNQTTSGCLNGGYKSNPTSDCICPPGFKGYFCETGCGPNSYGADCKGVCSIYTNIMCRGMFLCTDYGCTCPVGLTGPWCDKDCDSGKYGADCNQTCSLNCNNGCDRYTGICFHGCSPGYMLPYCLDKYPYLINPPELLSSNYESLDIKLDLSSTNIKGGGTNMEPKYYQLFYKILGKGSYNTSGFNLILNDTEVIITLSDLQPNTTYVVGALLITDDGNFNKQDIIYSEYNTSCTQPRALDYNVKLESGIKSIFIKWNIIQTSLLECHVTEYLLTLMSNKSENQEIVSRSESYYIRDLLPGIEYKIKLTAKTNNGALESSPIYSAIPRMKENDAIIKNISTVITNRRIKVFWNLLNPYQHYTAPFSGTATFIIKYKLTRVFSCSSLEPENEWTSQTIVNQTNYEIHDTVPNSQYTIRVSILDDDQLMTPEHIVYASTPTSSPNVKPILDIDHPLYVTNDSVNVKWKIDSEECSKMNGFFSIFYLELSDLNENILRTVETKNYSIYFDNLKSNTSYELKVFIKTSVGYSPEHYLVVNFKTKNDYLDPVDDLMVYKKSLKSHMIGLRWSYLEVPDLNGFLVSFDERSDTTDSIIVPLEHGLTCSAWPEFYCKTFYNINLNKNYTFKIKPRSEDYPEGGEVSSVSFDGIDGPPDSPDNFITNEVGNTTVNIQWDIPWIFNGVLETFIINYEEVSSVDINSCCSSIIPIEIPIDEELPTYNYTLENLKPGSTYSIGITTSSESLQYSSPATISVTTLI